MLNSDFEKHEENSLVKNENYRLNTHHFNFIIRQLTYATDTNEIRLSFRFGMPKAFMGDI